VIDETFRPDLFAGKVALVTGGTSGIGAAIADALAGCGATVTVTGARDEEVAAARGQPSFRGRDAVVLDVRDEAAIARLIGDLPRLDIVVNCAGTIRRTDEHHPAVFANVVDVNLTGTMRVCAAAHPLLRRSEGAIVNTASMLSFFGAGLACFLATNLAFFFDVEAGSFFATGFGAIE